MMSQPSVVQDQLERLVAARLTSHLSSLERTRYEQVCDIEADLVVEKEPSIDARLV